MGFPVDIKFVKATQAKLGVKFPASFVNEMIKHNGGVARTQDDEFHLHPFFDTSDKKRLKRTCNDIVRETMSARDGWYGFPPNGVVIGTNSGGDLLILLPMADLADTLQHCVYWWDHETGETNLVADDYSELVYP